MFILAAALHSCKSDGTDTPYTDKGSISVSYLINDAEGNAVEYTKPMTIIINGPENRTLPFPDSGLVEGLPAGSYIVQVCSHTDGMPAPAFETPCYSGTAAATVEIGKTTEAKVVCTLQNSGLLFEYDKSLTEAGLDDIVMTVIQGDARLEFGGADSKKCGYFTPGNVDITMRNGDRQLNIGGEAVHTRELEEGKIYRMTISVEGIVLSIHIEEITNPGNSEEVVVDDDGIETPDYIMTRIKSCTMHWDPAGSGPVQFDLCVTTADRIVELWIRGFTKFPEGDEFHLADGVYNASGMKGEAGSNYGAAMTFAPGHHTDESYMPTTGFKWTDDIGLIDDAYYGATGVVTVRRSGDDYFISADLTGDAEIWTGWGTKIVPDTRKIYHIKLPKVTWVNTFITEGTLEYDDVPAGPYTASGTNVFYDQDGQRGPDSWNGNITQDTKSWKISKWSDIEGDFYLDYEAKRMWLSEDGTTIINDNYVLRFGAAYLDENGVPVLCWRPEAKFDKATNTIDFAQKHFLGADLGICGILDYQNTGTFYLATDIYTNAKLVISPSSRAANAHIEGGTVIRVPEIAKLIPLKVDRNWNAHSQNKGYAYPANGRR